MPHPSFSVYLESLGILVECDLIVPEQFVVLIRKQVGTNPASRAHHLHKVFSQIHFFVNGLCMCSCNYVMDIG